MIYNRVISVFISQVSLRFDALASGASKHAVAFVEIFLFKKKKKIAFFLNFRFSISFAKRLTDNYFIIHLIIFDPLTRFASHMPLKNYRAIPGI